MNEHIETYNLDKNIEDRGMVKNRDIVIIKENNLVSCRNLFNIFWKTNKNIIYVTDDMDCFVGIITDRSLLNQMRQNEFEKPEVNKKCSVIHYKEDRCLFERAEALFQKYHITTAIPVIDEDERICYEIRKKDFEDERKIIEEFQEKIRKYKKSYYLKNEIKCLKKLLEEQEIIVIGDKKRFDDIFGILTIGGRITYVEELEDVYNFMYKNKVLLIDLSQIGRGRIL